MQEFDRMSNLFHYIEFIPEKIISSPIIYLHGWGSCASAFSSSLRKFVGNVFAPDLPGFGRTRLEIASWDYESFAKAILLFADSVGLRQFHLVGHSLGGGISMKMCAMAPDRIKSLVLIDCTGKPYIAYNRNLFMEKLIENVQQAIESKFSLDNYLIYKPLLYNLLFNFSTSMAAMKIIVNEDIGIIPKMITTRTVLVWGEKDRVMPLEVGNYLSTQIPHSHLIVLKEKFHEWSLLYPQILSETVNDFIVQIEHEE
jgi:pimeloyl-ACP methyl ester carboxylesterase